MSEIELVLQALDLEPIKFKLVKGPKGPQWTKERADRAEINYKRFLTLVMKYPAEVIVPIGDVDIIWHQHILDTRKYAEDCQLVFGYFLHHFPYFGLRGIEDANDQHRAGNKTAELFLKEFGESIGGNGDFSVCGDDPDNPCSPTPSCSGEPDPVVTFKKRPRFDDQKALH